MRGTATWRRRSRSLGRRGGTSDGWRPGPRDGGYADCAFDFDTLYHLAGRSRSRARSRATRCRWTAGADPRRLGLDGDHARPGAAPDRFPEGCLRTFDLTGDAIAVAPGVAVPLSPFFGTLGTAPDRPGRCRRSPARGRREHGQPPPDAGSTLWLPVHVPGALFSVGDPHAAQGDGEVCVSACECPMRATLRFTLLETPISAPSFRTAPAGAPRPPSTPRWGSRPT